MVNYANSKVYKIWSTQGDKIYVGSTTKKYLSQRMDKHRSDYKRWKDGKDHMITSFKLFEEYGLENCFIELLETKECDSKDELLKIEGKYIRELECVNRCISGRSRKEQFQQYYKDNKEIISEKQKKYNEINKEKISEHRKQFTLDNKERLLEQAKQKIDCACGSIIRISDKARHNKSIKHCQYIESQITKPEDGAE